MGGPERYLVALGRKTGTEAASVREALGRAHALGGNSSPLATPLLTPVVTVQGLAADDTFMTSHRDMTVRLCERNTQALNAVVDRAQYLEEMALAINDELREQPQTVHWVQEKQCASHKVLDVLEE